MSERKIYISGPITNMPGYNKEAFDHVAKRLRNMGHMVVNPHELFMDLEDVDGGKPWTFYMKRCIPALLDCDLVVLLPNHEDSLGVALELHNAKALDIEIVDAIKFMNDDAGSTEG